MGFWTNYVRSLDDQQPRQAPPAEAAVAPGAWWQQGGQRPVQRAQPQPQYQQPVAVAEETCPRCGSEDYGEFQLDVSYGGTVPPGVGALRKQCFDCRYPMFNATGDLIRGKGAITKGTQMQSKRVRQIANGEVGSWDGSNFERAINIDSAVRH